MSHGKNIYIRKNFYLLFQRVGIKYLTNISGSVVSKHESKIFKQRNWRASEANQSQREQTGKEKRNGRHQRSKRLALHNIYIIKSQELRTESMPKGTFVFLRSLDLYFFTIVLLTLAKKISLLWTPWRRILEKAANNFLFNKGTKTNLLLTWMFF